MDILSELKFKYRVIIDRYINAPSCGKIKIEDINRSNKAYLKQQICMIGIEESNDESMRMNASSMICDKKKELKFKHFSG